MRLPWSVCTWLALLMITVAARPVAGSSGRGGRSSIAAADALLFGRLVAVTSVWSAIRDPLHRPIMRFADLPLAVAAGLSGWLWTAHLTTGIVVMILTVPLFLAVAGLLMLSEGLLVLQADRAWLLRADRGRACAKVKREDSGQVWVLESVAAWPFGVHLGTELIERICADAEAPDSGITSIRLTADTAALAGWYATFGFTRAGRNWLGQPKMTRTCRTP